MKKAMMAATAGLMAVAGAAFAQEEDMQPAEPVAQVGDCKLMVAAPEMPDPKEATAEDRSATIAEIKAFQGKLNEYRDCLTAVSENEELEVEPRQAALDEFNRTVKVETKMVEDWQKFDKKYKKENA